MKRIICIIMCLIMSFTTIYYLTGCNSREKTLGKKSEYEEKQIDSINKELAEYINNKDKRSIKRLFAKGAQSDIEDIDSKTEELIYVFKGNKILSTNNNAHVTSGSQEAQPLNITANCIFKLDNGKQYVGWISFCTMDDKNKENVGLKVIEICNCSPKELPENHMWNGINSGNPGIFIHYIN